MPGIASIAVADFSTQRVILGPLSKYPIPIQKDVRVFLVITLDGDLPENVSLGEVKIGVWYLESPMYDAQRRQVIAYYGGHTATRLGVFPLRITLTQNLATVDTIELNNAIQIK